MPQPVRASIAARLTIWIWAGYAIWQGMWIVAGGIERWQSPSFAVLRQVPNHPSLFWGILLVTFGTALGVASLLRLFWVKAFACIGIAIWSICFASGALVAAHHNPNMASTGGPTYIAIAVSVLVLVFVDERRPLPKSGVTPYDTTRYVGGRRDEGVRPPQHHHHNR